MKRFLDQDFVHDTVRRMVDGKNVSSAVLRVESGDSSLACVAAAGEMHVNDRYFIASVTKLYVTAVVMRLVAEGNLRLNDRIIGFFPEGTLAGLHVIRGVDHTSEITVAHLMSNTSGLPDYFFGRAPSGRSAGEELLAGKDEPWPLERILATARALGPRFRPGQPGRALYSDTNYELLGAVVEQVTGKPIAQVFQEFIFGRLGLQDTYAFQDEGDDTPAQLYYTSRPVRLPRYLASVTAEGGIVSTAAECMKFLKAFFAGVFSRERRSRTSSGGTSSSVRGPSCTASAWRRSSSPGPWRRSSRSGRSSGTGARRQRSPGTTPGATSTSPARRTSSPAPGTAPHCGRCFESFG